jgi:hypothetical protein
MLLPALFFSHCILFALLFFLLMLFLGLFFRTAVTHKNSPSIVWRLYAVIYIIGGDLVDLRKIPIDDEDQPLKFSIETSDKEAMEVV